MVMRWGCLPFYKARGGKGLRREVVVMWEGEDAEVAIEEFWISYLLMSSVWEATV